MKKTPIPSQATLHRVLDYNPQTGKLFWKSRPLSSFPSPRIGGTWNSRFAGKEAFTALRKDGYRGGAIFGDNYLAHRIIFKMLHGYDPDQVDHDNRDRSDNRPHNLVDASATINSQNSKLYSNNTSGYAGVTWNKERGKWLAQIVINGRPIYLGRFEDINDAISARQHAEQRYGFHHNHGR